MRLPRMPLLLVAFTVPTSVTTAYAESAWVLWIFSLQSSMPQCGVLPSLPRFSIARYVLLFVSSSAHAFARPELGILSPRGVVFQ